MFKIFETVGDSSKEVVPLDGVYTVHELGLYGLRYSSTFISHNVIFIEDEIVHEKLIKSFTSTEVITVNFRFFEDYFGFASVSINGENFQINILGEKLRLQEIEDMITYLFSHSNYILNNFISKSSIGGEQVYDGKDYLYSSKYLRLIEQFCDGFDSLYNQFKNQKNSKLLKKYALADYNSLVIDDKSVEWILSNLDSVLYDSSLKNHPDVININNSFGIIEKIGADQNKISYSTYENEVILGSFKFVKYKLSEIKFKITDKLNNRSSSELSLKDHQYIDFRDLKKVPYLKLLSSVELLENKIFTIRSKFTDIFEGAKERNEYPKLTPNFYKSKHYQSAYNYIRLLRNAEYDLSGEIQLLNVRKISELYELYNLSIIVRVLDGIMPPERFTRVVKDYDISGIISEISYENPNINFQLTLHYEPNINNETKKINLITIGNTKLKDRNCKPDFVLELKLGKELFYCILDSKYSKLRTVKSNHLTDCIKKYIIDVGIRDEPYKKADYLILLHPDSDDSEENLIYNADHYPKIQTVISKPMIVTKLELLIKEFSKQATPH